MKMLLATYIQEFVNAMRERYMEKVSVYKSSWRTLPIHQLQDRLREQVEEWNEALHTDNYKEAKKKLVDIGNLCWMIWNRMEETK